ncbi:MAG: hypothetical protein HUU45_12960, partial [Leptospiraceae bacterium]|nr:hypothetical protein [Leptospiraceae bacterium]
FVSKKIALKFSTLFGKDPFLKKIAIYGSKLTIDTNDPISDSILEYFQNFSLSEVTLKNTEITVIQNGKILFTTEKPVNFFFKKEQGKVIFQFSDNTIPKNLFSKFYGKGEINLKKKTYTITTQFQNFPAENLQGLSTELIGVVPESGKVNSSFEIQKEENSFRVFGQVHLNEINGFLDMQKDTKIKNLFLSENFHITRSSVMVKGIPKYEFSTKRDIVTDFFHINLEKVTTVDKLNKIQLFVNTTDLEKFSKVFLFSESIVMEGGFVLKLELNETGKEIDWFKTEASLSSLGMNFKSRNSSKVNLDLSYLNATLNKKGELTAETTGTSFGKDFSSKLNGNILFSKIRDRYGNIYYPLQSDTKLQLQLQDINLSAYKPIYDDLLKWVQSDIKERQEKLIPVNYIFQTPLYKILFEKMKLSSDFNFSNLKVQEDNINLGNWNIKTNVAGGQANITLIGGDKNQSSAILKLNTSIQSPYIDLKVKTGDIFWLNETIPICGVTMYSDIVNLDFSLVTTGNNFWDFLLSKRVTGTMEFRNSSIFHNKATENKISALPFLLEKDIFSYRYEFDVYAFEGFKRKIELKGSEFQINGNSQIKEDSENFFYTGIYKKVPVFYSVTNTGESCIKK